MSKVISPFVSVEVIGLMQDCNSRRTKAVSNNGFRPVWDEKFDFFMALPEMALIRFAVFDSSSGSGEFIGQTTMPFDSVMTGYLISIFLSFIFEFASFFFSCFFFFQVPSHLLGKREG